MQLRRLALRNLRSYTDAELEFGPGTTLVAGDVGSGKTSLLYAVEMALFGFAEVDDAAHLVRHQAPDAEVSLSLSDGEHSYELRRKFVRRHRKGRELFEAVENSFRLDGSRTQYSATELRQRAIELLGFPDNPNPRSHSDLWRWAVYIPQERMRDVLDQDPDARLGTVRKALGLEQFRAAADNAQDVASELRQRAEIKTAESERLTHWVTEVAAQAERLAESTRALSTARAEEEQRRRATAEIDQRAAELQSARRQVEADQREADEMASQRVELERARVERAKLALDRRNAAARLQAESAQALRLAQHEPGARAQLAALRGQHEQVRQESEQKAAGAAELAVARSKAADLERQLGGVERDADGAHADLASIERELEQLAHDGPLREPLAPVPEDGPTLDELVRTAQAEVDRNRSRLARAEQELEEVSSLVDAGVCPRCHQPVSAEEFLRHAAEAKQAVAEAADALGISDARRATLDESRKSRERFERAHDRWVDTEKRRGSARTTLDAARRRAHEIELRRAALIAERAEVVSQVTRLAPVGMEVEALRTSSQRLEREIALAQSEAEDASRAVERAAAGEAQYRLITEEVARLDEEDARSSRREAELRARRESLAPRLAQAASLAETERTIGIARSQARAELDRAVSEIARCDQQRQEAVRRLAEAEAGATERGTLVREAEHLRALGAWFTGPFREAALRLERQMLGQAHREFERGFSRYFGTLIEDPSLIARLDPHFDPYVEVDGDWTPPAALSGGERTALALAYRLALGGVVRSAGRLKLTTLILDEPTDGFSPEQVTRMGELLDELGLPQVILVSHEAGLSAVADRVVRVTKRSGISVLESDIAPVEPGSPAPPSPLAPPPPRRRRTMRLDEPPPADLTR
jgi:exonuclease SbcC